MKKYILFISILVLITSCKSYFVNSYFKSIGVYDNKIILEKLVSNDKEIVCIGMHHLGKKEFYDDVKTKIDSLKKEEYFFYLEGIGSDFSNKSSINKTDSLGLIELAYKLRKINGNFPISKGFKIDYSEFFKQKGIKLREVLMNQPSYVEFGLSTINSKNTDLKIEELLKIYEAKKGKIILDSCDYKTPYFEKSICKSKSDKKTYDKIIFDERNNSIISHILSDKKRKIAIIYGKIHFIGIKDSLQKIGYKIVQ